MAVNMSRMVRTITPGPASALPIIVCVLPEPVAPYANTVALYPLITLSISAFAVPSYTSVCVAD